LLWLVLTGTNDQNVSAKKIPESYICSICAVYCDNCCDMDLQSTLNKRMSEILCKLVDDVS